MKVKILHLADAHLGCRNVYLAERARERAEDFRVAFREAVEYALDRRHGIDGVVIAGNLFEYHRPDEELWSFAQGLLSRLMAKGVFVAMIPGNHDSYAYKNSVYRTENLPGVELFLDTTPGAPRVLDVRGTRVFLYGYTYIPGQTPEKMPAFERVQEKGVHIGLAHGCVPGHPEYRQCQHQHDIDLDVLAASGLDYVALGGYQTYTEYKVGDTAVVYPGCLEGRGFQDGETGEKGPVIVEFDDTGVHIERRIQNRRTIARIALDLREEKITDADALKNAITSHSAPDAIVELTLTGTAEFVADLDEIREDVADGFYHFELVDRSRIHDSALIRKIESENTIRGYFVRKLAGRIEKMRQKIDKEGATPQLTRKLKVMEAALKLGVEQFIEEEAPADSIYSLIPDSDELVEPEAVRRSVGVGHLEDRVKEMLEHRRRLGEEVDSGSAGSRSNGHADKVEDRGVRAIENEEEGA